MIITGGFNQHGVPSPPIAHLIANAPGPESLTPAEMRIVGLIAVGWKPREVRMLHSNSYLTIRSHLYRGYRKIGIRDRGDLILWGVHHRIASRKALLMPPAEEEEGGGLR